MVLVYLPTKLGDFIRANVRVHIPAPWFAYLSGAKRREWMGMGVAGIIIDSYCGSFPHSLLSTSTI